MKRIIDLHIHTNKSDGKLSPFEVIDEAAKNGVSVVAIADHDTIDAYSIELYDYAINKNVKIINAVEISTKLGKINIHILGYNFSLNNKALKDKLVTLKNSRHIYLYKVSILLKELGYIIDINKLNKIEAVTKAHIANDIINNIKNHETLIKQFGSIPSIGKFIETMLNEGCPAFLEKDMISPIEACKLIKDAGGKVILAHPVTYGYENNLSDRDLAYLIKKFLLEMNNHLFLFKILFFNILYIVL